MTKKIDWVEIAERKTTGEFITVIDRDAKMTNRERRINAPRAD